MFDREIFDEARQEFLAHLRYAKSHLLRLPGSMAEQADIQALLGHKSIATTQLYANVGGDSPRATRSLLPRGGGCGPRRGEAITIHLGLL